MPVLFWCVIDVGSARSAGVPNVDSIFVAAAVVLKTPWSQLVKPMKMAKQTNRFIFGMRMLLFDQR